MQRVSCRRRRILWALLAATGLGAPPLAAQTAITQPAGLLTNPANTLISDPPAADAWLRRNVRSGGSVGIDGAYPRAGNASMFLELAAPNMGNAGKADAEYFPSATFGRLADLGTLSYDWYRDSASVADAWLHPALRLVVDADGNTATTTDVGYLIYERCYNVMGCPAVPTNTWVSDGIAGSTILWWFQFGVGADAVYTRTLATYQSGAYTPSPGFAQLGPNSLVLGVSVGVGSGWTGTPAFRGAADMVRLQSTTPGAASIFHNFELASDVAAVSLSGLAGILGPGQSVTGLSATCTNQHPSAPAANATCAVTSTLGTVSGLNCTPPTPVASLPPGGSIVCTFTLTDTNTPGGGPNAQSAGVVTVTASATADGNPSNDQLVRSVAVLDAVNESVAFPGGTPQSINVAANDGQPAGFTYNYVLLSSTCGAVTLTPAGIASLTVPPGGGTCTIGYRLCADPPNASACDDATLTVTASTPQAVPATGALGLALLASLIALLGSPLRLRAR